MPSAAEHADALRWTVFAAESHQLVRVGSIAGVVPLAVASRCGPGTAAIRSGPNGIELSFRAPGSQTWGVAVDCAADGSYLLEDGEDLSKWLRVQVYADHLPSGPTEASVRLADRLQGDNYTLGMTDIAAADAASGKSEQLSYQLTNVSGVGLSNVRIWLDAAVQYLEIQDGAGWVTPTDEQNALVLGDIAPGSYASVTLRRTIPAGSGSDPDVLNYIHVSFDGV